jgi:hypothetical protein
MNNALECPEGELTNSAVAEIMTVSLAAMWLFEKPGIDYESVRTDATNIQSQY